MFPFMIWYKQPGDNRTKNQRSDEEAGRVGLPPDSAAIMHAITQAVPDPFIVLDGKGMVLSCNTAAHNFAGHDITGQHLSQHIRAPRVLEAVARASAQGLGDRVVFDRRVAGGRRYEALVTPMEQGQSVSATQELPAVTLLLRDLSAQQNLEKMRADFVANASHELRTPLASMTGYIETLQGPAREDGAAREKFLGRMLEQAHRMRRLIDDLLSLSRIEMNLHRTPSDLVDVSEVAHYCVEFLTPMAIKSGCKIKLDAPTGMMVNGQRDELIQVCQNLIENALKYGTTSAGIEVKVSLNHARKRIELSVTDHGAGIDAEHLPRLTERFYRVNEQESRSVGGTGLGLAIVKHIALHHRGQLEVISQKGQGSTFTFVVPAAVQLAKAAE